MATTGERIKMYRKRIKLTQTELAELTGYDDRSSISKIEAGINEINESKVVLFAKALGVTPAEILGFGEAEVTDHTISFPILGEVAAGYDKDAITDDSYGAVEIPASWLKGRRPQDYFVLRVSGDSMYPLYQDGDLVLVLSQTTMNHSGQIGVVSYEDNSATLKKIEYIKGEDWMRLVPLNPNYPPIMIRDERLEHCRVHGIAKMVIREVN